MDQIKGPNIQPKTIKLLKAYIGENLHDFEFGNDFLDVTRQ